MFFKATNVTVLFGILKMPERRLGVWGGFFTATKVTVMFGILKTPECYLVVWKELFEVTNVTVLRGDLKMPECFLVGWIFRFLGSRDGRAKNKFRGNRARAKWNFGEHAKPKRCANPK